MSGPPPNVVEPYTNLGLVEWPETNYEPVVSNSAAAFASASGKQPPNYAEEYYPPGSATPSGNSSSASNSSVSTSRAASGFPQGSSLSPSEFHAALAQKEQTEKRDKFMIKRLEEIMEERSRIPKGKKVPFPEGLTELAATLLMRGLKNDTTITNKERADLQKYLLILMGRESPGGNNSSAASAAPVYVPMTEEDIIYLRVLRNFIGIESGLPEDRRVPLSSELINLAKILGERKEKIITVEESKTLKEGLDAHVEEVKATRGSSGGKRRKSRKSRKSQSGRKTKSRKSHRRR